MCKPKRPARDVCDDNMQVKAHFSNTPGLTSLPTGHFYYGKNHELQEDIKNVLREHQLPKHSYLGLYWVGSPIWNKYEDREKTVICVVELDSWNQEKWREVDEELRKLLEFHDLSGLHAICLRYYLHRSPETEANQGSAVHITFPGYRPMTALGGEAGQQRERLYHRHEYRAGNARNESSSRSQDEQQGEERSQVQPQPQPQPVPSTGHPLAPQIYELQNRLSRLNRLATIIHSSMLESSASSATRPPSASRTRSATLQASLERVVEAMSDNTNRLTTMVHIMARMQDSVLQEIVRNNSSAHSPTQNSVARSQVTDIDSVYSDLAGMQRQAFLALLEPPVEAGFQGHEMASAQMARISIADSRTSSVQEIAAAIGESVAHAAQPAAAATTTNAPTVTATSAPTQPVHRARTPLRDITSQQGLDVFRPRLSLSEPGSLQQLDDRRDTVVQTPPSNDGQDSSER